MNTFYVVRGTAAEKTLIQDYESVLSDASPSLSETEYRHLFDVACIGYACAAQKDDFVEALNDTITGWISESRRANLHLSTASTAINIAGLYNETEEVKKLVKENQGFKAIPTFMVCFGAIVLALFCIFATALIIGILQASFFINPVYLLMLTVGFLGLLLTDIVAIVEWGRDCQDAQR